MVKKALLFSNVGASQFPYHFPPFVSQAKSAQGLRAGTD